VQRSDLQRWAPAAAIVAGCCLLLASVSAYGIWDPWETEVSELARKVADGESVQLPHIGPWLVGQSFRLFGVHEWSGRLPIALCGLLVLALGWRLVATFADRRAAYYSVLIGATTPLFIFNAGTLMGEAPTFAIQTAIGLCALLSIFGADPRRRLAWLAAALVLVALGVIARGALLGVLPPLAAVSLTAGLDRPWRSEQQPRSSALSSIVLSLVTLALIALIGVDVVADRSNHSLWTGGSPVGGQPPSFDAVIERIFHAFAPWSALLPLAFGRIVAMEDAAGETEKESSERRLRLFVLIWAALQYATLTLFLSRYGQRATVASLSAFAIAVALWLRDVERSRASQWPAAIVAVLLGLLLLRDYVLYPISPLLGLPVAGIALPEHFNPKRAWIAALVPFCVIALLTLGPDPERSLPLRLAAPYRWLAAQWRRGLAFKLWLIGLALAFLAMEVFGIVTFVPAVAKRLTTLGVKLGRLSMLLPPALPLLLGAIQCALYVCTRLRGRRSVPMLIAGCLIAGYAAFGFMPALSAQLSPRGVYETYNQLSSPDETLAEYRVGARAAAYYARGESFEVDTLTGLIDHLIANERRWAVFPSEELAEINRAFRKRADRHLFVADARNARALLATNLAIAGREDQNALAKYVLDEAPAIQKPVQVNFDDKILLLGYALQLPHGDHVGQGDHFTITWYFKALHTVSGNYRIFVHIDGPGARIGGDHDPVDGKYPIRLWAPGDVIVDEQRIDVPSSAVSGVYTIFVGLYAGDTRLPIKEGPRDEVNRANAGVLRIR
jgi:hypothetical protein